MKITPEQEIIIAAHAAAGLPQNEIAHLAGVSQSTVSSITRKEDIRKLIEETREKIVTECVEQAKENIRVIIHSTSPEDKALKLKYSAKVLESIGALPSHAQGMIITNIYAQGNEIHLEEAAVTALKHLSFMEVEVKPIQSD